MAEKKQVSEAVIKRLPKYYRLLAGLSAGGAEKISSRSLGEMLGITASQVRQDFCSFGGFGQQGYGYTVSVLKQELATILGLDKVYNLIIIGGGNIGKALTAYKGFSKEGFRVKAVFDTRPDKIKIDAAEDDVQILHIDDLGLYMKQCPVDIAVIATPANVASKTAKAVSELGIKCIWNFASAELDVPEGTIVETVNLLESLYMLSYRMNNNNEE